MTRQRLARALLVAGLAWAGAWAALDVARCLRLHQNRPWTDGRPSHWRFAAPSVDRLSGFLEAAAPLLPPDEPVVFAFGHGPPEEALYGYMWAAYLLPGHLLVQPVGEPRDVAAWVRYGPGAARPPAGARLRASDELGEVFLLP